MNIFRYIDSYEKALVFWLCMIGLAFLSIFVGMEVSRWFENFFQLSS